MKVEEHWVHETNDAFEQELRIYLEILSNQELRPSISMLNMALNLEEDTVRDRLVHILYHEFNSDFDEKFLDYLIRLGPAEEYQVLLEEALQKINENHDITEAIITAINLQSPEYFTVLLESKRPFQLEHMMAYTFHTLFPLTDDDEMDGSYLAFYDSFS